MPIVFDIGTEFGYERMAPPINPNPTQPRSIRPSWRTWMMAGILTVLVHGAFIGTSLMGKGGTLRQSLTVRNQSSLQGGSSGEFVSTLILIDESKSISPHKTKFPFKVQFQPIPPPAVPVVDVPMESSQTRNIDASGKSTAEYGAGADSVTLAGLYKQQVKARIDRLLETNLIAHEAIGKCHVTVVQTQQGAVMDVQFQRCIALPSWRKALVQAIHHASPLPAPPDPKVFIADLELEF